jgi:hypothetical protein
MYVHMDAEINGTTCMVPTYAYNRLFRSACHSKTCVHACDIMHMFMYMHCCKHYIYMLTPRQAHTHAYLAVRYALHGNCFPIIPRPSLARHVCVHDTEIHTKDKRRPVRPLCIGVRKFESYLCEKFDFPLLQYR